MTRAAKLTKAERSITALQRSALEALTQGPQTLHAFPRITVNSILYRKLIDRIGPKRVYGDAKYVLTDLGRSVLAHRAAHTGRATR